jgi:hypothetical protein
LYPWSPFEVASLVEQCQGSAWRWSDRDIVTRNPAAYAIQKAIPPTGLGAGNYLNDVAPTEREGGWIGGVVVVKRFDEEGFNVLAEVSDCTGVCAVSGLSTLRPSRDTTRGAATVSGHRERQHQRERARGDGNCAIMRTSAPLRLGSVRVGRSNGDVSFIDRFAADMSIQ